jgi:hypothetical protein
MHRIRSYRPSRSTLVLVVALVIAAGGIAYASIPGPGTLIRGCYTTAGTHSLQVIDSAARACPGGTTALNWNQTGPKGATGATGPKGPAGSFKGLYRLSFTSKKNHAHSKKLTLLCHSGDQATGGGYQLIGALEGRLTTRSLPVGDPPNGWQAKAFNLISPVGAWQLKVWVVCAKT